MAIVNRTQQEKLDLANALDKCAALVRRDAAIFGVSYGSETDTALAALGALITATAADSTVVTPPAAIDYKPH